MNKLTQFIGAQFGSPRGLAGVCCSLVMNAMNRAMYRGLLDALEADSQSRLLDVGCGNGYLIQKIHRAYQCRVYGVDPSEEMRRMAERRNRRAVAAGAVRLDEGDCCALDYEDGFFDGVTTVNTIYFWPDTARGLREIHRVLRPGGCFYNAVYTKEWLEALPFTRRGFRLFEQEELMALGRQAGFGQVWAADMAGGRSRLVGYRK